MAAYGAAVSLKNTIQRILQSSCISLVTPSPQILQPAYKAMVRLQKVLVRLESTGYTKIRMNVNDLDERIKDVVWEFEDLLESHVTHQILPQLERSSGGESQRDCLSLSVDLQSLRCSIDRFVDKVMVMERAYDIELRYMPEEEGQPISSRIDYGGINSKMVGLSDEFERVRDYLIAEEDRLNWLSVIGMAGVGKTTLAKKVFDDPTIQRHFKLRAWVKVGRKCESNETLRCILAQVDPNTRHRMLTKADDDDNKKLVGLLEERWKDKKCLIVLDDVWEWDKGVMDNLPKENVRVLLTSWLRFNEESSFRSRLGIEESPFQVVRLLDEEESKKLLGEKVFGEEGFPPQFEKLGEKIARKCEGHPLMIVTVAELLCEEDMTPQYWTEVVEKQHNPLFNDAYNQISEVFLPSYDYLPQLLKMFFLYLGAFPPYRDIESNIFNLMRAEGFLEPIGERTLEDLQQYALMCLLRIIILFYSKEI